MLSLASITAKPFTMVSAMVDQEFMHWVNRLEWRTGMAVPIGSKLSLADSLRMRKPQAGYKRRQGKFVVFNLREMVRTLVKPVDLVYYRNVLVNFAREQSRRILEAFVARLNPGGLLVLGLGELTGFTDPSRIWAGGSQTLAYQRVE